MGWKKSAVVGPVLAAVLGGAFLVGPSVSFDGDQPPARAAAATATNRLPVNGRNVVLNGVNVPWGNFGMDIGCGYDADRFERMFSQLEQYGANSARFWLHIDARCSPSAGDDNWVSGVPAAYYDNLDDFLDRARDHDVAVLLTLWSFDITKNNSDYQQARGNRTSLITDPARTAQYVDRVLVPMAKRYDRHTGLLGYEIINEPEWSVTETNGNDQVALAQMQRFIAQQVVALQRNTSKLVNAAGSAMLKWNTDRLPGVEGNWWSDDALAAQVDGEDKQYAFSDFNQVHWYDWGKGEGYDYSPWQTEASDLIGDGKPIIVGEFSARGDKHFSLQQMIDGTWERNLAGFMPWTYDGVDSNGSWDDIKTEIKAFRDAHPDEVDLELGTPSDGSDPGTAANGYPYCRRDTDTDPDGDGWGWENQRSCVVRGGPGD